jgi:hypothetical protein
MEESIFWVIGFSATENWYFMEGFYNMQAAVPQKFIHIKSATLAAKAYNLDKYKMYKLLRAHVTEIENMDCVLQMDEQ